MVKVLFIRFISFYDSERLWFPDIRYEELWRRENDAEFLVSIRLYVVYMSIQQVYIIFGRHRVENCDDLELILRLQFPFVCINYDVGTLVRTNKLDRQSINSNVKSIDKHRRAVNQLPAHTEIEYNSDAYIHATILINLINNFIWRNGNELTQTHTHTPTSTAQYLESKCYFCLFFPNRNR